MTEPTPLSQSGATELTPEEAKALRIALIFGDPKNASPSTPAPVLESAKRKLKEIEANG
jgi:hypothetical protein